MALVVGIDSGGTFTDTVAIDGEGRILIGKAHSTPDDYSRGVLSSLERTLSTSGLGLVPALADTAIFAHGTTIATNALLTRRGAKTGLITTRGFEDTIFIGRVHQKVAGLSEREIIHAAALDKPRPLVPRSLVRGITERIDFQGKVLLPMDQGDARQAIEELVAAGVEAIAVCLLSSYKNPVHERQLGRLIREVAPQIYVGLSSDLVPKIGEYERSMTAVLNCYLGSVSSRYLHSLSGKLSSQGLGSPLLVMQCTGGVLPSEEAAERSVYMLNSGPVGGAMASKHLGNIIGETNIICTDVGGTSFDVGLIADGDLQYNPEPIADRFHTFVPSVDIRSIGTGGGSIAWIEPVTGVLKVGPASAGADPGPVCYDRGGDRPTVTDADVVLGYIDPNYFLGGQVPLNKAKAEQAIREQLAIPLGAEPVEVAAAIFQISNSQMADLVRKVTIERGYDPADFTLFAYGGAGPAHVAYYAGDVGVRRVLIPGMAAVFSAFGCAVSDLLVFQVAAEPVLLPADSSRLNAIYADLEAKALASLRRCGIADDSITLSRLVEMRYKRQVHELTVEVPHETLDGASVTMIAAEFEAKYERLYGHGAGFSGAGIEMISYSVVGTGRTAKPVLPRAEPGDPDPMPALKSTRLAYFPEAARFVDAKVFDYARLRAGHVVRGPAIIEAPTTTMVVPPEHRAIVDPFQNVIIEKVP